MVKKFLRSLVMIVMILFLYKTYQYYQLQILINEVKKQFIHKVSKREHFDSSKNNPSKIIDFNKISTFEWDTMYFFNPSNSCCYISDVTNVDYLLGSYSDHERAHILFLKNQKLIRSFSFHLNEIGGFPAFEFSKPFCKKGYCKFSLDQSKFLAVKDTFLYGGLKYILVQQDQLNEEN